VFKRIQLTKAEAQSMIDAADTLEMLRELPITADLNVYLNALRKLKKMVG
jgi:hypothetical protein